MMTEWRCCIRELKCSAWLEVKPGAGKEVQTGKGWKEAPEVAGTPEASVFQRPRRWQGADTQGHQCDMV